MCTIRGLKSTNFLCLFRSMCWTWVTWLRWGRRWRCSARPCRRSPSFPSPARWCTPSTSCLSNSSLTPRLTLMLSVRQFPFFFLQHRKDVFDVETLRSKQGWKKPGFFFKTQPSGFFGFLFFSVFGFFYIFAQKREFLGFFCFKNIFRCIQTLNMITLTLTSSAEFFCGTWKCQNQIFNLTSLRSCSCTFGWIVEGGGGGEWVTVHQSNFEGLEDFQKILSQELVLFSQ